MDCATIQATSVFTATLSALAAVFSATTAYRSFQLACSIQEDMKSDERLIIGAVAHPALRERSHAEAVIQIPIFNKSKRKAYIDGLSVYDRASKPIDVTWSEKIDNLGNPEHPSKLVGVIDSVTLYIRRNDGEELNYARVLFSHSFSENRDMVIFDSSAEFVKAANEAARNS